MNYVPYLLISLALINAAYSVPNLSKEDRKIIKETSKYESLENITSVKNETDDDKMINLITTILVKKTETTTDSFEGLTTTTETMNKEIPKFSTHKADQISTTPVSSPKDTSTAPVSSTKDTSTTPISSLKDESTITVPSPKEISIMTPVSTSTDTSTTGRITTKERTTIVSSTKKETKITKPSTANPTKTSISSSKDTSTTPTSSPNDTSTTAPITTTVVPSTTKETTTTDPSTANPPTTTVSTSKDTTTSTVSNSSSTSSIIATSESTTTLAQEVIAPSRCPSSYTGSQCNAQTYWCPDQICIGDGNCFSYLYYDCNCTKKGSCHIENAYPLFLNGLDCFNINTVSQGDGFYFNFYAEFQNYNGDAINTYSCGCNENYGQKGKMQCGLSTCHDNSTNPCSNDAGCVDKKSISSRLDILYCTCQPGEPCFKDRIDHCLEAPCSNSSTCFSLFTNSFLTENFNKFNLSMSYTCQCEGNDQQDCFKETDPCFAIENQCYNGGTCVTYLENGRNYTKRSACICPEGTTGNNCESFIKCLQAEESGGKACYFGGECIHSVNDYFLGIEFTCECQQGFKGKYCDECDLSSCENGGTCFLDSKNSVECICPYGFKGKKCEIQYDFCEFKNEFMCNNETGVCSTYKDYYCHCDNSTKTCEMQSCDLYTGCINLGQSCQAPPDYHSYGCNCYMISQTLTENSVYGRCNLGNMDSCNERIFSVGQSNNWYYNTVKVDNICQDQCSFGFESYLSYFSYFCECPEGQDCLIPGFNDPCVLNLCSNGSTCLAYSQLNQYTCKCEEGSTNCLAEEHPCSNNPCQNGGTCLAKLNPLRNNTQEATCLCTKGAHGEFCENTIDYCMTQFCGLNGRCINAEVGKIKCECYPGYTGKFCDIMVSTCDKSPCLNGGECSIDDTNILMCKCNEGFSGKFCQNRT